MRVIIAAAGTAGHINPGLAIANKIKSEQKDSKIIFIGTTRGLENDLVPRAGYELKTIDAYGLSKKISIENIQKMYKTLKGYGEAKEIIKEFKPDIVIGTGGYICGATISAAHSLKIPTLLHESNAFPGKAIKMLAKKTDTILVSFKDAIPRIKKAKNVVFTGNYTPPERFEKDIGRIDDEYTAFYHGIIDDFIGHPHLDMTNGIIRHLWEEVEDITEDGIRGIMPNMIMIDLYVRNYFRGEVVKHLVDAGIQVACFGSGWDNLNCRHPENIINGGLVDSASCLHELGRAKISLNVMPWFKDGAHDRVFNSMLNGAVCFTDWSRYLREELEDGKDVMFYELDALEELPERIQNLLEDRTCWEEIQSHAFQTAKERHTWADRAQRLHEEILCNIG